MTIQRTVCTSPVEALAALMRALVAYEQRYQLPSAEFYARYQNGEMRQTWSTGQGMINTTRSLKKRWSSYSRRRDDGYIAQYLAEAVAPLYGWFTEGFGSPDRQEAKVLLNALS